jgi:putative AlgH/UPF0301 family transcriptional regulator
MIFVGGASSCYGATPAVRCLFDADVGQKWERALAKIGISPELLSAEAGHA